MTIPAPSGKHPSWVSLPRTRYWAVLSFFKPKHFGLCFVQSASLSFSPYSREGFPPGQLPSSASCTCLLSSREEAPAAGDSCPWALAKPHKRAGQGSALPSNLAEWAGEWQGGVGTVCGLGEAAQTPLIPGAHSSPWLVLWQAWWDGEPPHCRPIPTLPSPGQPSSTSSPLSKWVILHLLPHLPDGSCFVKGQRRAKDLGSNSWQ